MRSNSVRSRVVLPPVAFGLLLGLCAGLPAPVVAAVGHWSPLGPEGGFPFALAFSPADPRRVYAGLIGGGVFRSADGGASWTAPTGAIAGLTVYSLAVDPAAPGVAYAGTSDGVWKTASVGESWQAFASHLAGFAISALAVDPSRPQTVYAETANAIYRSDNGGRRWTAVREEASTSGLFSGLLLAAPDRLFAVFQRYDSTADLYLSRDRGATWTLVDGLRGIDQVSGLTFDPLTHLIYLAAAPAGGQSGLRSLWTSRDGGVTWASAAFPDAISGSDLHLAVNTTGLLYAGSAGVFETADQGAHWTEVGGLSDGGERRVFGAVTALAPDPARSRRLLAGTVDLGIFSSNGTAWSAVNRGLTATAALGFTVNSGPHRPTVLHAALSSLGVFESRDGGAHWTPRNAGFASDGFPNLTVTSLEADPQRPESLYAGVLGGIAHSSAGGDPWDYRPVNSCVSATILAVDPVGPTLYAGGPTTSVACTLPCFAYLSRDGGSTWSCIPGFNEAEAAIVDPLSPSVAYVASDDAGLLKTTDHGAHFAHADSGLAARLVRSLAISPSAHRTVYAGTESGVWKTTDGGAHWAKTGSAGLPGGLVSALAVDPADARIVYAGVQATGVFRSADGGATWEALNEGLPTPAFAGPLRLDPKSPRTLYAGTVGSGFWAITLP